MFISVLRLVSCDRVQKLTLEAGVFSTLDLVSVETWSSSKMPSVLERCLLVGESKALLSCPSDAVSSNLGGLSSKLIFLSVESLRPRISSLQRKRLSQIPAIASSHISFYFAQLFTFSFCQASTHAFEKAARCYKGKDKISRGTTGREKSQLQFSCQNGLT